MQTDVIILGGGASGLAACAALADTGLRIGLVERLDRVGKKILSTGNGRCNLSNVDMNPAYYGEAAPFVSRVYEKTPPEEVLSFFSSLGLMTASDDGRIYPRTMSAASMLDVLRAGIDQGSVQVLCGQEAARLSPSRRGGWSVQLSYGEGLFAPVVLCAMGGSAAPALGTDGTGVRLLTALGHEATKLYPALVQLRSDHRALKSLKGVRVQAALTLEIDGRSIAEETGELLFADYGVSGVCVFQLSRHVSRAIEEKRSVRLLVHLLPEISSDELPAWLSARITQRPNSPMQSFFTGVFHRLLAQAILREANIPLDAAASSLTPKQRSALCDAISRFTLPITGTQGMDHAQVTRGGISLSDVDPASMASRLFDGLYLAGEVLDVDGPCGGYNLHFAFAGGLTAAKAIRTRFGL